MYINNINILYYVGIIILGMISGQLVDWANKRLPEYKKIFSKDEDAIWVCRNCGHVVIGKKAPEICPVCSHPQSYFELKSENY